MFRQILTLPKTVWLIGLISLVNDSASEMLYPLIPLYLSSVLMAGPKAMGLIEGIAEATASLLKLFSGVVVDKSKQSKSWIVFGYSIAALGRPLIAITSSWVGLLMIRFMDRVGKGLRTSPRDALLASSVNEKSRGLAFGFHRAMDNAGAVIGPGIAFLLLSNNIPLYKVFLWTIIPGLICVCLALSINEPPSTVNVPKSLNWRLAEMPPIFKRYLVVVTLFTLSNSSNMFLLFRAHELGIKQAQIPLLWGVVSLVAMLFSTPLSALSDKIGRKTLLLIGYLAYAFFYLSLSSDFFKDLSLYVIFGTYGIFMASTEGVEKALIADLAPKDRLGTAYGWFNLTTGIFLLPASFIFGWLYQSTSVQAAFSFSAIFASISAILLIFWIPQNKLTPIK